MQVSRWVLVSVCLAVSGQVWSGTMYGQHFPHGAAAVEYAYGPNGLWRDTTGLEYVWNYNETCATSAHPYDIVTLIRYGANRNVTARDSNCVLLGDFDNDGELDGGQSLGFAFFEHAGQGPGGTLSAAPFYHFWFDDNWLAAYMADAYGRPRPAAAFDRGQTVRWRQLGGDNRYWVQYPASEYIDRIALNGIYKLNARDLDGALGDWSAILALSGAHYDWDNQRYDYPNVRETYHLALWTILSEQLLAEGVSFYRRNEVLQHAMALRSQLLSLQERDSQGRLLGWITDIGNSRSLINTETLALSVLALGARADWVFEPGYSPMWSAPRNYFLRPHNALSAVVGLSQPGHIVYGPYWNLEPGYYEVEFALRTPSSASPRREDRLATLDVYDGKSIVRIEGVRVSSLPGNNQWQRYRLAVRIEDPSNKTEFRVYWHGHFNLDVGPVRVTKTASVAPILRERWAGDYRRQPPPVRRAANRW